MIAVRDPRISRKVVNDKSVVYQGGEAVVPEEWDYEVEPEWDAWMDDEAAKLRRVDIKPTEFVEFAMTVPSGEEGKQGRVPFSFEGRDYLRPVYDGSPQRLLLKAGRQVEKSTLLGNRSLSYMAVIPDFRVLYVAPSNIQAKTFSSDRIKEPIMTSEILSAYTSSQLTDNVFLKKLINRSQITLRYAYQNADRVRGLAADLITIDEIQDILTDNIPVIEECASHSIYKYFVYSGTPKSLDNPLEYYWNRYSTQNEWVIPCRKHGTPKDKSSWFWNILMEENIGHEGLICAKCGGPLRPDDPDASWASMNPTPRVETPFVGYRIPQLMVPWIDWADILNKQQTYNRATFYNEVLGMSHDSGTRPLVRADIERNCEEGNLGAHPNRADKYAYLKKIHEKNRGGTRFYVGIDWGGQSDHSYTVVSVGAYINGKFTIVYVHRFTGPDMEPDRQFAHIEEIISDIQPAIIGADYGGGHWPNNTLTRRYGIKRVHKFQYSTPREKFKWDNELGRWIVNRTEVMSDLFTAVKRGDVFRYPRWLHFEDPYARDMLNVFTEYNETRNAVEYKHAPDAPDDTFHSMLYCFLAGTVENPRPDIFAARG